MIHDNKSILINIYNSTLDRSELIMFNIKEYNLIKIDTIHNVRSRHLIMIENKHQRIDYTKFIVFVQKNDLKTVQILGTTNGNQYVKV